MEWDPAIIGRRKRGRRRHREGVVNGGEYKSVIVYVKAFLHKSRVAVIAPCFGSAAGALAYRHQSHRDDAARPG